MLRHIATSALLVILLASLAAPVSATVLTFHIDNPPSNGDMATTYSDYGDNVNSLTQVSGSNTYNYLQGNGFTPDLQLTYSIGADSNQLRYYTDDQNDDNIPGPPQWKDVAFLWGSSTTTERKFFFTITPDIPTAAVRVNSFDLFRYTNNQSQEATWTLYQDVIGGTVHASAATGPFNTTIDAPLTVNTGAGEYFGTLILEIHHQVGTGGGFALDNLNFDQLAPPIPEPSSIALMALGAMVIIRRTRRGRRLQRG